MPTRGAIASLLCAEFLFKLDRILPAWLTFDFQILLKVQAVPLISNFLWRCILKSLPCITLLSMPRPPGHQRCTYQARPYRGLEVTSQLQRPEVQPLLSYKSTQELRFLSLLWESRFAISGMWLVVILTFSDLRQRTYHCFRPQFLCLLIN